MLIAGVYVMCVWRLSGKTAVSGWEPVEPRENRPTEIDDPAMSNLRLGLLTAGADSAILAAGTIVTLAAEGLAEATGTDTGIMGLTLLAVATSLPELSTAIAAVKLRRVELAIGDILGGNMFDAVLILLVDALAPGGPILREVDRPSMTAALIAVLLTALSVVGLVERRGKTVFRMGYDSVAVLVVYAAGMAAILAGVVAGYVSRPAQRRR